VVTLMVAGDAADDEGRLRLALASGVICAGGCLGILIPPSIMLIVYGAMAGLSVVKLYAAAFVPGFSSPACTSST
jgi:TRAP-type mannitol/chloroaromatic compound transport system permease large subunit